MPPEAAPAPKINLTMPTKDFASIANGVQNIYARYNKSQPFAQPERLYGPAQITNAAPGLIYTVPATRKYQIDLITIVNGTAGIVQVDLAIGGAPAAATRIWQSLVPANSSVYVEGPIILNAADTLNAVAGAVGVSITVQAQRLA